MTTYHFQLRTDSHVSLSEVAELDGLEAARIEAAKRVGVLLHEHARQLWVDEGWQMDVTNEAGLILFTIHVSTQESPASQGSKRHPTLDDGKSR